MMTVRILQWYQRWLSPLAAFFGAQCRFHPTCSSFAVQAFQRFSWPRACWMTLCRLGTCHPWHNKPARNL